MTSKRTKKHKKNSKSKQKPKPSSRDQKKSKSNFSSKNLLVISGIGILLLAMVVRFFAFSSPIMGDEAAYSILGKKAMMGQKVYLDFYELKPPLLFYVYGLGIKIFTWSTTGLRLLGYFLVLCNSFLIFRLARKYSPMGLSLIISGLAFFTLNNSFTYATETVSEHFVLLFVFGGYLVLVNAFEKQKHKLLILAGFLIAGAAMIKQTAALYGMGAVILTCILSFSAKSQRSPKFMLQNIGLLASGAIGMTLLNILIIILQGTWSEAVYWLYDRAQNYASRISLNEGLEYMMVFFKRIFNFQKITLGFIILSSFSLIFNFRKKYFPLILILLICSLINLFPGNRFYGQYWIPLFTILPLATIGFYDLTRKFTNSKIANYLLAFLPLFAVVTDSIIHQKDYFTKDYKTNAEVAHSGNYPYAHYQMLEDLKTRMKPSDTFVMLGSEAYAYLATDRFPNFKHIYPRLISRDTPENRVFQEEALSEFSKGYDFVMLSVTGVSWHSSPDNNPELYQKSFNYAIRNYDPIWVFNFDEKKYYSYENGDDPDLYKPNQLITFKKK